MNIFISIQTKELYQVFYKECIHLKTECFQISLVMVLGLSKGKLVCLMIHWLFFSVSVQVLFFSIMNRTVKSLDYKSLYSKWIKRGVAYLGVHQFWRLKGEVLLTGGELWEEDWVSLDDLGLDTLWFYFILLLLFLFFFIFVLTNLSGIWQII